MRKNVFKKILPIALMLILSLAIFFGCDKKTEEDKKDTEPTDTGKYIVVNDFAKVWGAPDTISIMQDVAINLQCEYWGDEWLDNADKLYCEGIKGDTEAVQVMITAKKDIASFNFKASDLKLNGGTATIDKSNIEVFAERYIEVKSPSSQSKQATMFAGWYPDALVPINAYVTAKENKISSGNNQGIWVNVNIPRDTTAGTYTANCTLTLDGTDIEVPITVKVFDVLMSETNHVRTAFDIWYDQIGKGEEYEDEYGNPIEWDAIYYDFLVSKRISPQATMLLSSYPKSNADFTPYVNEIVALTRNNMVSSFRFPYNSTTHDEYGKVVDKDVLVNLLTALAEKNIELVDQDEDIDLFSKGFFYFGSIIDEPNQAKLGAVKYCDRCVTEAKQEVALLLDGYPELQESLLSIQHLVTTRMDNAFIGNETDGGIQTWCCEAQNYTKTAILSIKERQTSTNRYSQGEGFWIYSTCNSNNPYPSHQLDDNLLSSRAIYWMMYKYNMSGRLFWNVNYYSKFASGQTTSRDIWNDPNTWEMVNGDGALLYPGTKYGLTTPISTLRLESNRQGIEDYEYLYLFKEALEAYNTKHSTDYNADVILDNFYGNVFYNNSTAAKSNVNDFANSRTKVLELLEAVVNDTAEAAGLLGSYSNK